MQVRKADANDAADISSIHAMSWKSAYQGMVPQAYLDNLKEDNWTTFFRKALSDGTLSALVICDGDKTAGCAAYGRSRDDNRPGWGEIVSIYLHPDYFGKGYGERLIKGAMDALAQQGRHQIYLWVLRENARARRFYEKHGFEHGGDECTVDIMDQMLIDLRYEYVPKNL